MNIPECETLYGPSIAQCPKHSIHPIFSLQFFFLFLFLLLVISCFCVPRKVMADENSASNEQNAANEPAVTAKILRYAGRLLRCYDADSDGRLQESEWKIMHGDPATLDRDGDRTVTLAEISRRIADYGHRRKIRLIPQNLEDASQSPILLQPATASAAGENGVSPQTLSPQNSAAGSVATGAAETSATKAEARPGQRFYVDPRHRAQGLPAWFSARDANGDQQISMAEFAPKATESDLKEFASYDADGDGIITDKECAAKANSAPAAQPTTSQPAASQPASSPPSASDGSQKTGS